MSQKKSNTPAPVEAKKSKRILTFDLLRGYFMVSIILNHLQWYPNGMDWVAARGSLFVSAAEGFFFISGIVLGIVRGRKLIHAPFKKAATLLVNRGVLLYVTSIILMLFFTFTGWLFIDNPGLKPGIRPTDESIWSILAGALSMQYIYGWADFLRLYSIFLIASPLALLLLRKNRWVSLMVGSLIIWALFPLARNMSGGSGELQMVLSWQFIFFAGMTIGFYWDILTEKWQKLSQKVRRSILIPILTVAAVTLTANLVIFTMSVLSLPGAEIARDFRSDLSPYFSKFALSPARLILFGLWFTLGFYLFHKFEAPIKKLFGWILLPFGQNSLYVYILHAVLLFFGHLILAPSASKNILLNAGASLLVIGLIYLAVRTKFLFKIIPR